MKTTRRSGSFLKQFVGPGDNHIVCFKFWQAVVASGCPGECSYCFLQTQHPYRSGLYDVKGTLFENLPDLEGEARRWLARERVPTGLIVGENQDGLAFERPYKRLLGTTPLEILGRLFRDENPVGHTLVVLSKFTTTEYVEALGPVPSLVFSWSLSLPSVSRRYEKKVASLEKRFDTARRLKAAGHRVRFRLDALVPIPEWRSEIDDVVDRINEVAPEMVTLGALRATSPVMLRRAAEANGRDGSIFDHLAEPDPSGFKYRTEHEFHVEAFRRVRERLAPGVALGLCKEDLSMWREAGVTWNGCHCLHGKVDAVANERVQILKKVPVQRRRAVTAS